jgi:hypothetical protein
MGSGQLAWVGCEAKVTPPTFAKASVGEDGGLFYFQELVGLRPTKPTNLVPLKYHSAYNKRSPPSLSLTRAMVGEVGMTGLPLPFSLS